MKCKKCKLKDKNTGVYTYPFKATATGDTKFDKDGNLIDRTESLIIGYLLMVKNPN